MVAVGRLPYCLYIIQGKERRERERERERGLLLLLAFLVKWAWLKNFHPCPHFQTGKRTQAGRQATKKIQEENDAHFCAAPNLICKELSFFLLSLEKVFLSLLSSLMLVRTLTPGRKKERKKKRLAKVQNCQKEKRKPSFDLLLFFILLQIFYFECRRRKGKSV